MPRAKSSTASFFGALGPGLTTGAADDDPSGIATYSAAGAAFGYAPLWTAVLSLPLMAAVQLMCSRLAMVSGRGLSGLVRARYPPIVLWLASALVVVANTINIAADLGGMASVSELITGVPSIVWLPVYAVGLLALLAWASYRRIAQTFKWLTLALFAYVLAGFASRPDWGAVLRATVLPGVTWSRPFLEMFVALLGTTISPYLFYWQAAQEVEEERAMGRVTVSQRRGATTRELDGTRRDVLTGMFASNLIMYFIVLSAAATLHAHGTQHVETVRQAAEALRPVAGDAAYWLFSIGIIGTGMLGVPVLAGSCAYAVAEGARWRASLDDGPRRAPHFYGVIAAAMIGGLAIEWMGVNAVEMLVWSAVLNGLLAPPLILLVVLLSSDPAVMGSHVNPPLLRVLGWTAFVVMAAAAIALVAFWII